MNEPLYLLVPVHNRRETTLRLIRGLTVQTLQNFQLVLIDDGSTDGTADAVREIVPTVTIIRGSGRWWWSGCLEQGCEWLLAQGATSETPIGMMNDDVEIGPDFLGCAREELSEHPGTLLLARQLDARTGAEIGCGGGVYADLRRLRFREAREEAEINCLPTRGLFLRWGDLLWAGRFRPGKLPHYLSDYEFTLRARRRGLQLRIARTFAVRIHTALTGTSADSLSLQPRRRRVAALFSPRCKDNPLAWSAFVSLAVPAAWRPWLWLKVWLHAFVVLARSVIMPVRSHVAR